MALVEEVCPGVTPLPSSRYATAYTMFPVFSLVLDQDVKPEMAMLPPGCETSWVTAPRAEAGELQCPA